VIVTANESALAQFEKLARLTDDELDLARAALLIAKGRDASVDVERYVSELEFLAATLGKRLAPDANASLRIGALNQFLFQEMGFGPNRQDYYDPRNSFLNEVIDRRKGIPITLSLVYMEIGRRIGLPLRGVSFPGHFLVKCRLNQGMVVLDPYAGGASPSMADLQKRLRDARGGEVSRAIVAGLLVAADKRDILARMLRNLKAIYMRKEMDETAMSVVEWLMVLNPEAPEEVRDRGLLFQRMECFRAALSDLERYLKLQPAADDVDDVYARVIELRQSAARLN